MPLDPKTDAQISALAPVQSVAGRTGAVTLSTSDVSGLGTAAAENTSAFDAAGVAAGLVSSHESDTTGVHGITDTSTLYRSGGVDVAVSDGGTGASSASVARSNLGLVIGTNVLSPSGDGSGLSGLTASQISDASANGRSILTAANYSAIRTLLGLVIGTNVQASDATLTALAALSWSSGTQIPALTAADTFSLLTIGTDIDQVIRSTLANDLTLTTASTFYTIGTVTIPTTGLYHLHCHVPLVNITTTTPRVKTGTATLGGSTNDVVGQTWGTSATTNSVLTQATPAIVSMRAPATGTNGYSLLDAVVNVTGAGTLILESSSNSNNGTIKAGAFIEVRKI